MPENLHYHASSVNKSERQRLNGHRSLCIWLTGLSGSGKSSIANELQRQLHQAGRHVYLLDGDNTRLGLNKDLGFSEADRKENIRRVAELCKLMMDAGLIVITAFISPFAADREMVRNLLEAGEFLEIFVDCPLELCEQRDPKGLYKKARKGELAGFTGIDSPYEKPVAPQLRIPSAELDLSASVTLLMEYLETKL